MSQTNKSPAPWALDGPPPAAAAVLPCASFRAAGLAPHSAPFAKERAGKEEASLSELAGAQGKAVGLGGDYHTDAEKTATVMRPSQTLNGIIG